MTTKTPIKIRFLDHFVFEYCVKQLQGKSPDDICAFYVQKFVFKNGDYLKSLMERYHLPNDFLKLHKKIIELSKCEYEQVKHNEYKPII